MTAAPAAGAFDARALQRRTRGILVAGQVLAGLGMGSTLSAGALLATAVSGSEAFSGAATTGSTIGAALAAVPLATLAFRRGRAPALATGALTAALGGGVGILAAVLGAFPLLVVGFALIGTGTAVNLQSRFAATDLADPARRGRDLSIVVWATTIGAIVGPNLIGAGNALGLSLGLPDLAGPFLLTIAAQIAAAVVYTVGLRPDPLLTARRLDAASPATATTGSGDRRTARIGIAVLGLSHATMASVMAMTPVHLAHEGATLQLVGLTISLHVAGMYALSPVWGLLADRFGRPIVIALGQGMLAAGLIVGAAGSASGAAVTVGLVLLGLGWSASTVAASALVASATAPEHRTRTQGRSDLVMSASGALGGGLAGPVLALVDYPGLALIALVLVAVATTLLIVRRAASTRRVVAP